MKHAAESGASPMMIHGIGAGAILLALGAGYLLVVAPVLSQTSERGMLERVINSDASRLQSLNAEVTEQRAELEQGKATIEKTGVELLDKTGQNTRMAQLTELANECGLRLDSLQPGSPTQDDMFLITPFKMRGLGSYDSVAVFLHETVDRFPDVSARTFRLEARVEGGRRLAAFEFDLAWYADPADQTGQESDQIPGTIGG